MVKLYTKMMKFKVPIIFLFFEELRWFGYACFTARGTQTALPIDTREKVKLPHHHNHDGENCGEPFFWLYFRCLIVVDGEEKDYEEALSACASVSSEASLLTPNFPGAIMSYLLRNHASAKFWIKIFDIEELTHDRTTFWTHAMLVEYFNTKIAGHCPMISWNTFLWVPCDLKLGFICSLPIKNLKTIAEDYEQRSLIMKHPENYFDGFYQYEYDDYYYDHHDYAPEHEYDAGDTVHQNDSLADSHDYNETLAATAESVNTEDYVYEYDSDGVTVTTVDSVDVIDDENDVNEDFSSSESVTDSYNGRLTSKSVTIHDPNLETTTIVHASNNYNKPISDGSTIHDPDLEATTVVHENNNYNEPTSDGSTIHDPNLETTTIVHASKNYNEPTSDGSTIHDPDMETTTILHENSNSYNEPTSGSSAIHDPDLETTTILHENSNSYSEPTSDSSTMYEQSLKTSTEMPTETVS